MRELRFRVWSEEDKQYRTDCYVCELFNGKTGCPATIYNDEGDRFDIEQYTGLKDENGKEIYEGDIVDYNDDGECIGVVEYDAPEFYLNADATNWARMFLKGAPHQRVIGNIHENPELLEGKESKPNWTDITHDDEAMERVLKGVAEMQNDILRKAEKIKKAMKNEPQQHEEDNPARHS